MDILIDFCEGILSFQGTLSSIAQPLAEDFDLLSKIDVNLNRYKSILEVIYGIKHKRGRRSKRATQLNSTSDVDDPHTPHYNMKGALKRRCKV